MTPPVTVSGRAAIALAILTFTSPSWSQAPSIDWDLNDAIRQIERQAKDFDSAMARIELVRTDADGNETRRSTGTVFVGDDGDIRYNVDGGDRVILVDRNTVRIHTPSAKQVEEYSLRKHKDRLEPFVRLGFSTTGKDLEDDYLLTIRGEETIGSSRTLFLELTPEKNSVREIVRLVRLWIDQASWMPVKQEFNSTNGQTLTLTYTGMARNLKLNPDLFRARWPRGTDRVRK